MFEKHVRFAALLVVMNHSGLRTTGVICCLCAAAAAQSRCWMAAAFMTHKRWSAEYQGDHVRERRKGLDAEALAHAQRSQRPGLRQSESAPFSLVRKGIAWFQTLSAGECVD
jgi:hypothetical protein